MIKTAGIISIISGMLLFLVPRSILPVCEYEGYSPMHCSETARAEYVIGLFLIAGGAGMLLFRRNSAVLAAAGMAFLLSIAAYVMPDVLGYCKSSKMPCHYGTVPAIRLIAILTGFMTLITMGRLMRAMIRKGPSS